MENAQLTSADDYYRILFDAGNDAMLVLEPKSGVILDANKKFTNWLGYTEAQWVSTPFCALIHAEPTLSDTTDISQFCKRLSSLREERIGQCQIQAKTGHFYWVEIRLKPVQLDDHKHVLAIIRDISEFKRNEIRPQHSEKNWRSIAENVPDIIIVMDRQGTIQFINKVYPGHDINEVIGKSTFDFQPPEYHEPMRRSLEQVFTTGEIVTLETVGAGSPGELRHYVSRFSPIKENNQVTAVLLIATDITDTKQAEQALRTSEASLRKAHEIAQLGNWSWDLTTNEVVWTDNLYKIYGYNKSTFHGATWDIIFQTIHPDDRAKLDDSLQKISTEHAPKWKMDYRIIRPDGELRYLWGNGEYLYDDAGKPTKVIGIVQDITERELDRQALQRSQAELKQRNLSLATINAIADRVFRAFDVSSVAREAVSAIAEFSKSPSISFYLVNRQKAALELAHTSEPSQTMADKVQRIPIEHSLSGLAVAQKKVLDVQDIQSDTRVHERIKEVVLRQGYVSALCLPAIFQDEVLGVINFAYKEQHKFSEADLDTFFAIGKSVGLALANARHISRLEIEMRDRKQAEETLRNIALAVSSATGDEFFRSLVISVANTFAVDYVFLGKLDSNARTKIKTLAVCVKGAMSENFEYDLRDTPCEHVMNNQPCIIVDSVQQKFPKDLLLQDMGMESYVGTPLHDSSGAVTGIFVALHSKSLTNPELIISMLQIFSVRAAAELERLAGEAALRRSEEHLRLALNSSNVGTWEWDIETGDVTWSTNVEKVFKIPPGSFGGGYEEYLDLIHPDDVQLVKTAIDDALYKHKSYAVEHRIKYALEGECWIYCQGDVYRDPSDKPVRMLGTISDITERKNTELKIKASQKMLQLVLDTIPARVFWKDINSVYLGCNKLFAQDAGLQSPYQIIGKTDFDMTWREQAGVYRADDLNVIQSGVPKLHYEEPQTQKDKTLWLETSKIPLTDLQGNIIGVLGTYTDISERKQAIEDKRRSEQRLMLHFQQTPLAVVEWDTDMKIIEWNQAAERIFGYSHDEAVGRQVVELIVPEEHRAQVNRVADSLVHMRGGYRNTNRNITKDGKTIICEWYNTPLVNDNGQIIGVASAAMDITERINAEQELAHHREHLEELVDQRTDELTRVNKEMEAFSYSVSHDLRAPLRSIDGFSQILMEDYFDKLDDEGKDYLQRVRQGAQRMAQLIDDMLKLSRLTRGQLNLGNINISEITSEITTALKNEAPGRSAEFHITPNLFAHGDEGLLTVVLDNLISNAWKYTSKKTHTVIELGARVDSKETTYWVKDNGAGFNMEYVDKLFGAFQRLHQPQEFDGSGIGLATVARIIHRHGGKVWAEGKEHEGATFYFTLPNTK